MAGLISLGTPVAVEGRAYAYGFLGDCAKPKLFVSGARDQFGPQESLARLVEMAPEQKELVIVEGADHFFEGHLAEMQGAIRGWTARYFAAGQQVEAG